MKRNSFIPLFCLTALIIAGLACTITIPDVTIGNGIKGSGNLKTETRQVSGFHEVVLSGIGDLEITQGQSESLEIEAEDNILAVIETKVENGTLYIGFKEGTGNVQPTETIKYTLSVVDVTGLTASGVGNIHVPDLKTSDLDVQISGVGNIEIDNLDASSLAVLISGAGGGEVNAGQVEKLKLEITGAGSFRGPDLEVATADVSITGVGNARLWVTEMLDIMLSGTGGVEYYGQPRVTQLVTGLGSVKSLGDHP